MADQNLTGGTIASGSALTAPTVDGPAPTLALSGVQYAAIAFSHQGTNTLVSAVAGSKIRVLSLVLVASGGVNTVQLHSGPAGIALTAAMDLVSDGQFVLPWNPAGWCETGTGAPLILTTSSANAVAGMLTYVLASSTT